MVCVVCAGVCVCAAVYLREFFCVGNRMRLLKLNLAFMRFHWLSLNALLSNSPLPPSLPPSLPFLLLVHD